MKSLHIKHYRSVRILLLILLILCGGLQSYAQSENTKWFNRIGHGRDSLANIENINIWNRYASANQEIAQKNDKDMTVERTWDFEVYRAWYRLTHGSARFSFFNLYASGLGGDMLRYLMYHEKDAAAKLTYFDDLMWLCDFRIQHLDELNSLPPPPSDYGPLTRSTLGDVKTWKAHFYYTEGRTLPPTVYDKLTAYNLFADAMKTVRQQKSVNGTEVEPYLLREYFNACYDLYKSDPERYKVQFLSDYLDCASTCKRLYEEAKTEQEFGYYYNIFYSNGGIKTIFKDTGVANPDSLDAYFRRHFEANKHDLDYVNTAIALMVQNGCIPSIDANMCVEQYAEVAYAHPEKMNYFSALAYGMKMNKEAVFLTDSAARHQKRIEMRTAFEKAFEYAPTNSDKAEVSLQIGKALNQELDETLAGNVDEVERWESDMIGVIKYYEDAITYDADHYAVVANYNLGLVYRIIATDLGKVWKITPKEDREKRYNIRKKQVENAKKSIEYFKKVNPEAVKSSENHVYEQDGCFLNDYVNNAQSKGINTTNYANGLQNEVKKYENATTKVVQKFNEAGHNQYHKDLAKDAFWGQKMRKCEYCGKTFTGK